MASGYGGSWVWKSRLEHNPSRRGARLQLALLHSLAARGTRTTSAHFLQGPPPTSFSNLFQFPQTSMKLAVSCTFLCFLTDHPRRDYLQCAAEGDVLRRHFVKRPIGSPAVNIRLA